MKILGINFSLASKSQVVRTESQAYNTPFLKIGKGNLSLPYIQSNTTKAGVIYFGDSNLFPQVLNQMYFTSPLHSAIVDFTGNAVMGGGVKIELKEDNARNEVDARVFMSKVGGQKTFRLLERDYYLHRRCHMILRYSANGQFLKAERVDPSQIRYRFDGAFEFCEDWATYRNRRTILPYNPAGNMGEVLYTKQDDSPGQDHYPIPSYSAALNWCYLDGEQSYLHKSNIQNSIFPSLIIRRPKRFSSKKEQEDFIDGLKGNKGSENAGNVGVLSGDGFDNTPEVVQVSPNSNDKLFTETSKSIQDNICFAHKINPSIMGIKVAGSLGNAQELEMSYAIWEKNVVIPERLIIEQIGKELLHIGDVNGTLKVEKYKLVGDNIIEGEDSRVNSTAETLSSMSPVLANKILEVMTIDQILDLVGLPQVEGGDKRPGQTEGGTEGARFSELVLKKIKNEE